MVTALFGGAVLFAPDQAFAQDGGQGGGGGGGAGGASSLAASGTGTAGGDGTAAGSGGGGGGAGNTGAAGGAGQGAGGGAGGAGGTNSSVGGNGGNATVSGSGGGGGGGASAILVTTSGTVGFGQFTLPAGGSGGAGLGSGAGGGGGAGGTSGRVSNVIGATHTVSGLRIGGAGGAGGAGGVTGNGGNGGDGGAGVFLDVVGSANLPAGTEWRGGAGGNGGAGVVAGVGGDGGAGMILLRGTLSNAGTLQGGAGGIGSVGGLGGIGLIATGVTINNTGTIAGGLSGDGVQGLAMRLSGTNTITNIGTLTGRVEITSGTTTFDLATDQTLSNVISGGGALVKLGAGRLTLTGLNTHTGETRVEAGTLAIDNQFALGESSSGTTVLTGATLELVTDPAGQIRLSDALTLNGAGVDGGGALRSVSGTNFANNDVILASDSRIEVVDGSLRFTATITGGGRTLTFGGAGNASVLTDVALGTGGVIKEGTGTVSLLRRNTYTGDTLVRGGVLEISGGGLGLSDTGRLTIEAGATARLFGAIEETFGSLAGSGNLELQGANQNGSGIAFGDASDTTFSGVISSDNNAARITKRGTGTVTLTGANTYAGVTRILNGTLQVGNGGTTGSLGGGEIENFGAFAFNRSDNATLANLISGTGTLTKLGTGTLTLSGANTYSGLTTVSAGTLEISNNRALGTTDAGTIVEGGAALALSGNRILGEAITLNGTGVGGTGALRSLTGISSLTGAVTLATDVRIEADAGGGLDFRGVISGVDRTVTFGGAGDIGLQLGSLQLGSGSVIKEGAGILGLSGINTFTGDTDVRGGRLQISGGSALSDTGRLTLGAGTSAQVISNSETIGSLAGSGTIFLQDGGSLVVGDASNTLFSGVIQTSNGNGSITKVGTGTLTLSGTNTYTGETFVEAGRLLVTGSLAAGVTVNGGTLGGTGRISGLVTIGNGGTLAAGQSPGTMTVGALTLNAGSITNFELGQAGVAGGPNNDLIRVTGALTLNGGTINVARGVGFGVGRYTLFEFGSLAGALGNLTLTPLDGSFLGTLAVDGSTIVLNAASAEDLTFWNGSTLAPTGAVVGGSGTWNLVNGNFTENDGVASGAWAGNGFNAVFAGTGGTVTIGADTTVAPSGLAFLADGYVINGGNAASRLALNGPTGVDTAANVGATINAVISGTGSLTKTGAGTLTLGGVNTYTGTTTVLGGTLVNSGTIVGTVTNSATLTSTGSLLGGLNNNAGGIVNAAGVINGQVINSGTFNVTANLANTNNTSFANFDASTLNVSGGNYTGLNVINNNSTALNGINVSAGRTLSAAIITNGTTSSILNAGTITTSNRIDNSGTLTTTGTINGGTFGLRGLAGSTTNAAGTINGAVSNAGTFNVTGNLVTDNGFTNTGTLNLDGASLSTLTLFNNAGGTTNAAGTLNGAVQNSGTFNITGNLVNSNATSFGNLGSGVLNVSGGNYTGLVVVTNNSTATNGVNISAGRTLSAQIVSNGATSSILNAGTITTSNRIDNSGTLTTTGTINGGTFGLRGLAGSTTNAAGTINGAVSNAGTFNVTSNLVNNNFITNTGTFNVTGATLTTLGLTNEATGTVNAAGAINGQVSNAGTFNVTGNLTGNNAFVNSGAGVLNVSGGNYTGLSVVTNGSTAAIGVDVAATRTLSAQTITNNAGSTIRNAGTLSAVSGITNSGTLNSTGAIIGALVNNGTANLAGTFNFNLINQNAGIMNITGNFTGSGGGFIGSGTSVTTLNNGATWSGLFNLNNTSTNASGLNLNGTLTAAGAVFTQSGATTTIGSTGIVTATNGLNVSTGGTLNNSGRINSGVSTAGTFISTGQALGGLNVTGGAASVSGVVNGAITNAGAFTVTGNLASNNTLSNTGTGRVTVNAGANWSGLTGFTNASTANPGVLISGTLGVSGIVGNMAGATLTVGNGGSLTAQNMTNFGTVTNNGTVNTNIANSGRVTNSSEWNGSFLIDAGGLITNNSVWANNSGFTSVVRDGTFSNLGMLIGGGVSVSGANALLANRLNGTISLATGQSLFVDSAGSIRNSGVIAANVQALAGGLLLNNVPGRWTGSFNIASTGRFTNQGTVNVTGSLVNSGTFISTGTVNGLLVNEQGATASLAGEHNGNILNSGLVTLTNSIAGIGILEQNATGVFDLAGFDTTIGGLQGAGRVLLASGGLTVNTAVASTTFSGVISGDGGLTKTGSFGLFLNGANTYTGLTTVNQGSLVVGSTGSLAGSVRNNANLINGGTIGGSVTNIGTFLNANRILGGLTNSGSVQLAGQIDGSVTNNGSITNLSGATVLGRFQQGAGGSLDLAGFNSRFGSLAGTGPITLGSAFLTVGTDNTSTAFDGVIGGTGGLVKVGTGSFTLNGVNTYTGTTFVEAGTLVVGAGAVAAPPPPPAQTLGLVAAIISVTAPARQPEIAGGPAQADRSLLAGGVANITGGSASVTIEPETLAVVETAAVFAEAEVAGEAPAAPMASVTPQNAILAPAVIAGNVVNSATLVNNGTILGMVMNNAGATTSNHGVIGGAVRNDGTLVSTGTLGGGLANNGQAQIRGVLDGDVINTGTITLTGITTGIDIFEQAAGGVFNLAGFDTTVGAITGAGSITLGAARLTTGTDGVGTVFNGVISGTGSLTKVGTGRLLLTGANTYTGGTTISGGALQLGNGGTSGSIIGPVVNNGVLEVDRSDAYTLASAISGTGMFVQDGTGTTTLTGANSYTGGTLISRGRLVGSTTSLQGQIQNNAALEFAQASAGVFAGQLFGAGLFDKTGLGLLELTGNSNGFTGGTFVRGGELRVTGLLANSVVTVLSGSTLSGSGTIGGLVANSGSTIAPGANGAGMLGVNGAVNLQAGSTVQLQIRAGGPSDAIVSNGAATLGGTAAFSNLGGTYAFNSEIILVQADGGRTGTFASTTGFGSFGILYRPELVYTANQARLRFAPNLLANIVGNSALTANQRSVVNRIDGAVTAGYNPQPLFNVYALPTAQQPSAFDQLSGEVYASAAGVGIEQERLLREAVLGRVNAVAMAARGDAAFGKGVGAWAQVFGGWGHGDSDGNAARIEADRTGFATGIDFGNANENGSWRAGVFGMRIQSDVTIDARGSSAEVEQSGGGVYASLSTGGFTATLGGYLTSVDLTASRTIALPGFAEVNNGKTGGEARQAFAEVSFTIPAGKGMVRPFLGATIGSFDLDAFTETGGAAALTMREQSYSTGTLTAGVDGMVPVGGRLSLFGTLAGRAQLGDRDPQAQLALAAAPQQAFGVAGVQLDDVALSARLDASLKLGKNVDVSVGYTGLIGSTISDHGARATLQVQF